MFSLRSQIVKYSVGTLGNSSGVHFWDPGVHFEDPGVHFWDPGVQFLDPWVQFLDPWVHFCDLYSFSFGSCEKKLKKVE